MARPLTRAARFLVSFATYQALTREAATAGQALSAIPGVGTGRMGLTPDAVKFSAPYRAAHQRYHAAAARERAHATQHVRTFKREHAAYYRVRRTVGHVA